MHQVMHSPLQELVHFDFNGTGVGPEEGMQRRSGAPSGCHGYCDAMASLACYLAINAPFLGCVHIRCASPDLGQEDLRPLTAGR